MTPEPPSAKFETDCWNRAGIWGDSTCEELNRHFHCRNCPTYANAALRLLNSRAPAEYRSEWTRHLARATSDPPTGLRPILVFKLGDHWMAIPTDIVVEVAEMSMIHCIPHRSEEVLRGVVNVRGELLVCVSLGRWFGFHRAIRTKVKSLIGEEERLVVTGTDEDRFVFPVSQVRGIRYYQTGKVRPPEKIDYPVANDFSVGAVDLEEIELDGDSRESARTIHILNHVQLFRAISMSLQ